MLTIATFNRTGLTGIVTTVFDDSSKLAILEIAVVATGKILAEDFNNILASFVTNATGVTITLLENAIVADTLPDLNPTGFTAALELDPIIAALVTVATGERLVLDDRVI